MSWSTVAFLGGILAILVTVIYALSSLAGAAEDKGSVEARLDAEVAGREERERVDRITDEKSEDLRDDLAAVDRLDGDELDSLLWNPDGAGPDTGTA